MSRQKLPNPLVLRLRRAAPKLEESLGRMRSADHRTYWHSLPVTSTNEWGRRVREMMVHKNYPGVRVVLKRTHDLNAHQTVRVVNRFARLHNMHVEKLGLKGKLPYRLHRIHAYPISENLVAMAHERVPTVREMLYAQTPLAILKLRELKEKRGMGVKELWKAYRVFRSNCRAWGLHRFMGGNVNYHGFRASAFDFSTLVDTR